MENTCDTLSGMSAFTSTSLPDAIASLFRLNHYQVTGPVQVAGAEIDLVARPLGLAFASPVYIEATVQYVDNGKYGKDLTKLAMVQREDPTAKCLIVSSDGFTVSVRERAKATGVECYTYQELFAEFEQFQPYVENMTGVTRDAKELRELQDAYQIPFFDDSHGVDDAIAWMDSWLAKSDSKDSWLIIIGEYGTGKSALTKMLQLRWLKRYVADPSSPIPIRIELGQFTRQFDAQGLLHHFLDHNSLGHVPVEFFWELIHTGRIVLILDGYDEMAQYLSPRERRETLKALAELSSGGARGLLTSRPNYFTEAEEFSLFDHLYREISIRSGFAASAANVLEQREAGYDELIQKSILDRYERSLRDLSPEQARRLVERRLRDSPEAASTVISILSRVFRTDDEGTEVSLSGKPVIIAYLIEVAETLSSQINDRLTEWEVYTLILDHLALRDLEQTSKVSSEERRRFLQALAIELTRTGEPQLDEERFRSLIDSCFKPQLRRFSGAQRVKESDGFFEDLRRSSTLTRGSGSGREGWSFSHNSLREFLATERMIEDLGDGRPLRTSLPISDAMRAFARSRGKSIEPLISGLSYAWRAPHENPALGSYLSLVWDAALAAGVQDPVEAVAGGVPKVSEAEFVGLHLSDDSAPKNLDGCSFLDCSLQEVSFVGASMVESVFRGSLLQDVNFDGCLLNHADFEKAMIIDTSFDLSDVSNASFVGVDSDISIMVTVDGCRSRLCGKRALGYLAFRGAVTDPIDPYEVYFHHPRFSIVEKISKKLLEGKNRQRRGLVQRGVANADPSFASDFLNHLIASGYVDEPAGRTDLVQVSGSGRAVLGEFVTGHHLPVEIQDFLEVRS